jgi:hypothetical protein
MARSSISGRRIKVPDKDRRHGKLRERHGRFGVSEALSKEPDESRQLRETEDSNDDSRNGDPGDSRRNQPPQEVKRENDAD